MNARARLWSAVGVVGMVIAGASACGPGDQTATTGMTDQPGATVQQMTTQQDVGVIEVVTFQTNPGVTQEQFLTEDRRIQQEYVAQQRGFISRETARGEDGEWLVIVRWREAADAEASMQGFGESPVTQQFMGMIDMNTMQGRTYYVPR